MSIEAIVSVIHSPKCRAYSSTRRLRGQIVADLQGYFLPCKCRPHTQGESENARPLGSRRRIANKEVCPMMGCLAPEMAVGEWRVKLNDLAATRAVEVLPLTAELSEAERGAVLCDFDQGKQRVLMTLDSKFAFY